MTEEQDKIVRFDEHSHSFNLPDTDFKAEVVASGLKEAGYDAERTLIFRRGDIRRGFSKDIHDIHPEYSHYDLTDYLYLYVNRRSLYDELPEGIFHKNLYQAPKPPVLPLPNILPKASAAAPSKGGCSET